MNVTFTNDLVKVSLTYEPTSEKGLGAGRARFLVHAICDEVPGVPGWNIQGAGYATTPLEAVHEVDARLLHQYQVCLSHQSSAAPIRSLSTKQRQASIQAAFYATDLESELHGPAITEADSRVAAQEARIYRWYRVRPRILEAFSVMEESNATA
jgi:hypothetical protein